MGVMWRLCALVVFVVLAESHSVAAAAAAAAAAAQEKAGTTCDCAQAADIRPPCTVVDTCAFSLPSSLGSLINVTQIALKPSVDTSILYGSLPKSLVSLTALTSLSIVNFQLSGSLPANLGSLSWLRVLDLSGNAIDGTIPPSLGSLLRATTNDEGSPPVSVGRGSPPSDALLPQLPRRPPLSTTNNSGATPRVVHHGLTRLNLKGNALSGTVPSCVGSLSLLKVLDLGGGGNRLTGTIPPSVGSLKNSSMLSMGTLLLSGSLPRSLASMRALTHLEFGGNSLSGTVPPSLGYLPSLAFLDVSSNYFSGTIPGSVASLSNITYFDASNNSLTGPLPRMFGRGHAPRRGAIVATVGVDVRWNQLTGTIPSAMGSVTNMLTLRCSFNTLTGTIPASLQYPHWQMLDLESNQLSGTLPPDVFSGKSNFSMRSEDPIAKLSDNMLSGHLPVSMHKLALFDGRRNLFQGPIPWFDPSSLLVIKLGENAISGTLPEQRMFTALDVGANAMSGTAPSWLGSVVFVNLSSNNFSGTIPPIWPAHWIDFEVPPSFDLSHNQFTGTLPDLANTQLVAFNASNNRLSGTIQAGASGSSSSMPRSLQEFAVADNDLTGPFPTSLLPTIGLLDVSSNSLDPTMPANVCAAVLLYSNDGAYLANSPQCNASDQRAGDWKCEGMSVECATLLARQCGVGDSCIDSSGVTIGVKFAIAWGVAVIPIVLAIAYAIMRRRANLRKEYRTSGKTASSCCCPDLPLCGIPRGCCQSEKQLRRLSPWRVVGCSCWSAAFERHGVLFADRQLEIEYLDTTQSPSTAALVVFGAVVFCCTIFWLAAPNAIITGDHVGVVGVVFVAGLLVLIIFVAGVTRSTRHEVRRWTAVSVWISVLTLPLCVAAVIISPSPCSTCHPDDTLETCAQLAEQCGFADGSPLLTSVLALWAMQKVVVVANLVPARLLVSVVFSNVLILLGVAVWLVSVMWSSGSMPECTAEFPECKHAVPLTLTAVDAACELSISVIAASGALLWTVLQRAAASRELFLWARSLRVQVDRLHLEADPFNPDKLRKWMVSAEQFAVNAGATDQSNVPDNFWKIEERDVILHELVASGGGGEVWRAELLTTGTTVAAKQLFSALPAAADINSAANEAFLELAREAALLAQLQHPNVVKFLGLCLHVIPERQPSMRAIFIIQEYCLSDVRKFMESASARVCHHYDEWHLQALDIARGVCRGMEYLHMRGLVHRDLKPENVLVGRDGNARIADFGASMQHGAETPTLRADTDAAGTLEYMAPEAFLIHCAGRSELSLMHVVAAPVDVYAAGVMLWELLLDWSQGEAPAAQDLHELWQCRRNAPAQLGGQPSLEVLKELWEWPDTQCVPQPQCPTHIIKLVADCCSFDAASRPDFSELATALGASTETTAAGRAETGSNVGHEPVALAPNVKIETTSLSEPLLMAPSASDGQSHYRAPPRLPDAAPSSAPAPPESCLRAMLVKAGLSFASPAREQAYIQHVRHTVTAKNLSPAFLVLCVAYLLYAIVLASQPRERGTWSAVLRGLPALAGCALFGTAWMSYKPACSRCLPKMTNTLAWLTFGQLATLCVGSALSALVSPQFDANDTEFNSTVVYACDTNVPSLQSLAMAVCPSTVKGDLQCSSSQDCIGPFYKTLGAMEFVDQFGLFFVEVLTLPVVLLVLNLPVRVYGALLLIPMTTFVLLLAYAVAEFNQAAVHYEVPQGAADLTVTAVATVVVYASCIASAWGQERAWRSLFVLHSSMQDRGDKLLKQVEFLQYRTTLRKNRATLTNTKQRQRAIPLTVTDGGVEP